MLKSMELSKITLGVCYYPEHWDESLWRDDIRRMKEHGIEVIRIAEFAWNLFEKEEGVFDFSFWDHYLDVAEEEGIQVIFCTPTATPPAWLTEKYPEVLNADGDGHLLYHGVRRHYNYNSPKYRELIARLVEKMGEHFNKRSCIIGWQLDNELNCEINEFHSESDHKAFREYLKEKYGTLENLNKELGTIVWNQTYTSWDEIHLTRRSVSGLGHGNPHLELEERRFISKSAIEFAKLQIDILKKTIGDRFITTNGIFGHLDYQALNDAGLDFITYDNYPLFNVDNPGALAEGHMHDRNASFNMARTRAISPVFGIMEEQSGPGGWTFRMLQPAPKPGQMKLWSWQAIAHGADYMSYFRWRTANVGTEIYWHGLNDYSNLPNRRLAELKDFYGEVKRMNAVGLAGKNYVAKVAILTDYDNDWDGEIDLWHGPVDRVSKDGWFRALQHGHIPFDFVDVRDATTLPEIAKYDLVVYPHATILTEARAALLKAYVEQGGKLVMGARTGYKDDKGRCPMFAMPGLAGEICGVRVVDYTSVGPLDGVQTMCWDGETVTAPVFNDILEALPGAEVQAVFSGNYYDGMPSVVKNTLGKGEAWYVGSGFGEDTAALMLKKLGVPTLIDGIADAPAGVEVAQRGNVLFFLNYAKIPVEIELKKDAEDILSGAALSGKVEMPAYGVIAIEV